MTWTRSELDRISTTGELLIAARRTDGTPGRWTPIWVVCTDSQVYVRTWFRRDTGWFGQVIRSGRARISVPGLEADVTVADIGTDPAELRDGVDTAYRAKYGAGSTSMVTDAAADTTLRLDPDPKPVP